MNGRIDFKENGTPFFLQDKIVKSNSKIKLTFFIKFQIKIQFIFCNSMKKDCNLQSEMHLKKSKN